ncbi:E3 SUMO-protein ligase ZBED1 [Aethina tumida]|uniref:E3 SUMO-protein ligase ZBED1 n=1 Tax=Aethina tumida TaxID=116153 RepID=UPI0021475D56|nr:E3 SUMO-protein ligase ZBED1 [Aethina tumida]
MSRKESVKYSMIWNFFEVKLNSDKIAICNICKTNLSYKSTSNNLKKHMDRKHPLVKLHASVVTKSSKTSSQESESIDIDQNTDNVPLPIVDCLPSNSEMTKSASESNTVMAKTKQASVNTFLIKKVGVNVQKKIDDKLMLLFTRDFQPFSVVEDYGFQLFVQALNPSYRLPTRKTIRNSLLPAKYEEVYNKTKEAMCNVNKVTLTTDCWTSSTTDNFLGVTAHFLNDNLEIKHAVLGCQNAKIIKNIIEEWHLNNKILIIISDNAPNIKRAIKEELQLKHFGCHAHTLNLIAQNSLKCASKVLEKIKGIVAFFKRSSSATTIFFKQQKQLNIEPAKKLIQDVNTRWNSTYYMIERFVELENPIRTTVALIKQDLPIVSGNEWEFLQELVVILKPLEDVTRTMSGENYLTRSSVIIFTNGLLDVYLELRSRNYCSMSKSVIVSILDGIKSRLGDVENQKSLLITTFLDPRFKNIAFSSDNVGERAKNAVMSLITDNIKETVTVLEEKSRIALQTNTDRLQTETSIWSLSSVPYTMCRKEFVKYSKIWSFKL